MRVTAGNYGTLLENRNREVRKAAFESVYKAYQSHINTYAEVLNSQIKQHVFFAKAKKFNSTLERALFSNQIDPQVYTTLIKEAHKGFPVFYEYIEFRRKKLKLKKIQMWDLRVDLFPIDQLEFTYDQAVDLCVDAAAPLGKDYQKTLKKGLTEGWVDKYENKGKRSGAFSGGCYDSPPYILMNFTGSLNDVYTLMHEGGHSMHSYLAKTNQPYNKADYCIFSAEIASTVNERLLTEHLLKKYSGNKQKQILSYEIDAIRATFFRQTMFAEFELLIHEQLEKGQPITPDFLNQEYQQINKKYYGSKLSEDQYIKYEWARIPHFYYNYYVYQYATGIAAAIYFAEQIKKGTGVDKYLNFLKSGGADFPLILLKKAGVDFIKPDIYKAVVKYLKTCLDKVKK
ncbi:hypothetical protein GF376_00005 [Candidatus Peregrinibacteria bacterium]|nr:hypothetical protein [Candidatus Peregrinibacteria bacterium]